MRGRDVQIHPLSFVSPKAKIGHDVQIGPFCVVEKGVEIGDGCILEARVSVKEGAVLGENNHLCEGAVIGGLPQHVAVPEECGLVIIGSENMIRENVTIHRALKESNATVVGDNNLLMVNVHVAHDCRLGNNIVMANNAMLAGHVTVGDRANISGAAGVHQFCRVGGYTMVGGQAHIAQDIPPFVTVDGLTSHIVGLNMIGLRRAGFSAEDIKQLKEAYHIAFRSQMPWRDVLKCLEEQYPKGAVAELTRFLSTTSRGIIREGRRHSVVPTLRLHRVDEETEEVATIRLNVG
ncbi:MAG: acyl-ACP--UDP-N-acetylglucosamine O-acyltransferase [Planctomycetaceae bacterium]|nr:acyl-ACP--UDP-N-acetylglucosamine O-acyltransferase [Planctomycetaceae bacterium]